MTQLRGQLRAHCIIQQMAASNEKTLKERITLCVALLNVWPPSSVQATETHGFKSHIAAAEASSCQTEDEGSVFLIYSAPFQLLLKIIHHYMAGGSRNFI